MQKSVLKERISEMGLVAQAGSMTLVIACLCLASLPIAISVSGADGAMATFLAAAIVSVASAAGIALGGLCYGKHDAVMKLLLGMVIRMLIPLIGCLLVLILSPRMRNAGFAFYVLVFYLLALPIETASLRPLEVARRIVARDTCKTLLLEPARRPALERGVEAGEAASGVWQATGLERVADRKSVV